MKAVLCLRGRGVALTTPFSSVVEGIEQMGFAPKYFCARETKKLSA